jgi:hypothetical protein
MATLKSLTIGGTKFDLPESGEAPPTLFQGNEVVIVAPTNGVVDLSMYNNKIVLLTVCENIVNVDEKITITIPKNIQVVYSGGGENIPNLQIIFADGTPTLFPNVPVFISKQGAGLVEWHNNAEDEINTNYYATIILTRINYSIDLKLNGEI